MRNGACHKFKETRYEVSALNPRLSSIEGDPCYPDLKSIPEKPVAVFILTNPKICEEIVQQSDGRSDHVKDKTHWD